MSSGNTVFVGNLSWETTEKELENLFFKYGAVSNVHIIRDRVTSNSKGFGFVTFDLDSDATVAIKDCNGMELNGRRINVMQSEPRESRQRGDRSYEGGGRRNYDRDNNYSDGGRGGRGGYRSRGGYDGGNREERPRYDRDRDQSSSYRRNYDRNDRRDRHD